MVTLSDVVSFYLLFSASMRPILLLGYAAQFVGITRISTKSVIINSLSSFIILIYYNLNKYFFYKK